MDTKLGAFRGILDQAVQNCIKHGEISNKHPVIVTFTDSATDVRLSIQNRKRLGGETLPGIGSTGQGSKYQQQHAAEIGAKCETQDEPTDYVFTIVLGREALQNPQGKHLGRGVFILDDDDMWKGELLALAQTHVSGIDKGNVVAFSSINEVYAALEGTKGPSLLISDFLMRGDMRGDTSELIKMLCKGFPSTSLILVSAAPKGSDEYQRIKIILDECTSVAFIPKDMDLGTRLANYIKLYMGG